ncbi:MAG: carboxylating nicotinate-nucleotide diphosphorylase [Bacteroidetes bacterium]|nr:carboxylating nicotinate-nucleotide diphosphorylase [Bacteroidota bacterium]
MNNTTGYDPDEADLSLLKEFISLSLFEDVRSGDHTSLATVPANAISSAVLKIKDNGVLAGIELAEFIFHQVDPEIIFEVKIKDGTIVKKGAVAFEVKGSSRSILKAERLVLNCMQRMSGIATATWNLVQLIKGTKAKLIDTRKTTPGFRYFEKWAVRIGGGSNHRFGLYDMILIKDNHVDFCGGIKKTISAANEYLAANKMQLSIEIEVRNRKELDEVLSCGNIQRIMLDNFSPVELKKAVKKIDGRFETEASGGITSENIKAYAETGVDFISVGSITHSVKSLDLSLKAK